MLCIFFSAIDRKNLKEINCFDVWQMKWNISCFWTTPMSLHPMICDKRMFTLQARAYSETHAYTLIQYMTWRINLWISTMRLHFLSWKIVPGWEGCITCNGDSIYMHSSIHISSIKFCISLHSYTEKKSHQMMLRRRENGTKFMYNNINDA